MCNVECGMWNVIIINKILLIIMNKYLKKSVNGVFVAILSDPKDAYINATQWIMKSDIAITSYYGENATKP